MNRVTALYVTETGESLKVDFDSWACNLLAQYSAAKAALEAKFGVKVDLNRVEFIVH